MAIQQLTEVQKKMLDNMCISAQEVNMGTLLSNLIEVANNGNGGNGGDPTKPYFVPVATNEVAGIVRASTEVVVDEEGIMSIGQITKNKVMGLQEELDTINQDIKSIMETGVTVTITEKIDAMENDVEEVEIKVDTLENKLTVVEEGVQWKDF